MDERIPYGYCHCGCGSRTNLSPISNVARGLNKGEPYRFILGHANKISKRWEVDPVTGCWNWLLGKDKDSKYGRSWNGRNSQSAHKVVWEELHGPVPEGKQLDHKCKNELCVNPNHLEPVTGVINIHRSAVCTLTMEAARTIRRERSENAATIKELATRHGVTDATIYRVLRGVIWIEQG